MLQTLSDCILLRIMRNIGISHSLILKKTNKELSSRMKPLIREEASRRIKNFWRWCRFFSSNEMLAKSFMRNNLTADAMVSVRSVCLSSCAVDSVS